MKNLVGIWIDIDQAVIINLKKPTPSVKKIIAEQGIKQVSTEPSKKIVRYNGHYLTLEKFKEKVKSLPSQNFIHHLVNELSETATFVLFGPSNFKYLVERELKKYFKNEHKIEGVFNTNSLSEKEMISWVENYYNF